MTTNLFGRESNREKEEREKDREREKEKGEAGKGEIETKKQNAKGCRARNRYSALPDFIPVLVLSSLALSSTLVLRLSFSPSLSAFRLNRRREKFPCRRLVTAASADNPSANFAKLCSAALAKVSIRRGAGREKQS